MATVFHVDCIAPIPVGHRVKVRVLEEPKAGFFSKRMDADYQKLQPWVQDLETGVEYGVYWQYLNLGSISTKPDLEFPEAMRADLEELKTVTGKVVSCRVITISGSNWLARTRLEVEEED